MDINRILLISRYEIKVLRRNWLFIFLVLLLVSSSLLVQWFIQKDDAVHFLKALSCSVPFINAFLFNFIQGIFVIFIAGDFIRRDRILDSYDLLGIRPYENSDYVIGKLFGTLSVFVILNIIVIVVTWIFHFLLADSRFVLYPYLFYFLTLTLPSLVFWVGLTLWITAFARTWLVSFVFLIGYFFFNIFVLSDCLYGSFDYLAISQPNVFSDATGNHVGLFPYLIQRIAFVLLGIAFMILAITKIKRLPNTTSSCIRLRLVGYGVLLAGILVGGGYYSHFERNKQKRLEYVKLYMEYSGKKRVEITRQQIMYSQNKRKIIVQDTITVRNPYQHKLNEFFFFLNPELKVDHVETHGKPVKVSRERFALTLKYPLAPGEEREFLIRYSGKIDESVCYLDVPDQDYYDTRWSINISRYGKHTALLEDHFTLLTPECLWYPTLEFPASPVPMRSVEKYFTDFELTVIHDPRYTVISQGKATQDGCETRFDNAQPLPGITLCMGIYHKRELMVDSTRVELYYFNEKGTLTSSIDATREGLTRGIRESKEYFEDLAGRVYPFKKFALVEVPVSFCAYRGKYRKRSERVQPEVIFRPESDCEQSFYLPLKEYVDEKVSAVSGISREEIEGEMIRNFCTSNVGEEIAVLQKMTFADLLLGKQIVSNVIKNPASIIPIFSDFSGYVYCDTFPAIDRVLNEFWRNNQIDIRWELYKVGMSEEHKAIRYLSMKSLRDALKDPEAEAYLDVIFRLKGACLKKLVLAAVDHDRLSGFMQYFWSKHAFSRVSFSDFAEEFKHELNYDLVAAIHDLYEQSRLPAFHIQDVEQYIGKEEKGIILAFSVWNFSDVDGVVTAYSNKGDGSQDLFEAGNFVIKAGESSRICFSLPHRAMCMILQTNLAKNIPVNYVCNFMEEPEVLPVSPGRQVLDTSCFLPPGREIIVDNEDPGFQVIASEANGNSFGKLARCNVIVEDNRVDFLTNNTPGWISSVYIEAYGVPKRSFLGKKTKSGQGKAIWTASIPEDGVYELCVFQVDLNFRFQIQSDTVAYYYSIEQQEYRADILMNFIKNGQRNIYLKDNQGRKEEFSYQQNPPRSCWVPIGTYSLSKGKVDVVLLDKGAFPGQLIFADAVKWVPE